MSAAQVSMHNTNRFTSGGLDLLVHKHLAAEVFLHFALHASAEARASAVNYQQQYIHGIQTSALMNTWSTS
jgi:hypothetical protein